MKNKIILSILLSTSILCLVLIIITFYNNYCFSESNVKTEQSLSQIKEDLYSNITPREYGYDIVDDFSMQLDDGKNQTTVKDVVNLFTDYPSSIIKQSNQIDYKEQLYTVENHRSDFEKIVIDKDFADKNGFMSAEDAYAVEEIDIDLSKYNFKKEISDYESWPTCFTFKCTSENSLNITFCSSDFETYQDFIQASYDIFYEIVSKYEPQKIKEYVTPKENYICTDMLDSSIDKKDYRILFDAIMNDVVAFVSVDDGINTRIEYISEQDENGENIDVLTVRKAFLFEE